MYKFQDFINKINSKVSFSIYNYNNSSAAFLVSLLKKYINKNIAIFVNQREIAETIYNDISNFISKDSIKYFNISKFFPFSSIIKDKNLCSEIINLLYSLLNEKNKVFIIPSSVLLKKVISPLTIVKNIINIKKGDTIDREILSYILIEYGYENSYMVSCKGEFSFRGDIFDIFVPAYNMPVRITMWDNIVEEINFFNIDTQKRVKNKEIAELTVVQNSEFIYSDKAIKNILPDASTKREKELKEKILLKQFDLNISMLPDSSAVSIFEYLEQNNFVKIYYNSSAILKDLKNYENSLMSHFNEIEEEGFRFVSFKDYFFNFEDIVYYNDKIELIFDDIKIYDNRRETLDLGVAEHKNLRKRILSQKENHFYPLLEEVDKNKFVSFFFTDNTKKSNISNYLQYKNLKIKEPKHSSLIELFINNKYGIYFFSGNVSSGFNSKFFELSIITEKDIFGNKIKPSIKYNFLEHSIEKFSELKENDYVVHIEHGIGIYKGLKKITVGEVTKEFIIIEYLNRDKLYLPIEKLHLLQKYVGEEGYVPSIDKLGSDRWRKVKEKIEKSVEGIAKELLELYASRKIVKGVSFKGNDDLIEEFSLKWEYEETPDQIKAIEEVLSDMDADYPMDRLLCGDVGYGKTEVAIRAILKAIFKGYQVAFLVPTTILALQHYNTLKERFKDYPFVIEKLSRFESKKEQKEILNKLENGQVDLVIGTHRLLQKDVKFKNLGLLIIDEEHKFGVKHKEKIKFLRKNLDVLSMTATPIPRTLQMSFLGVKDLSVINTPPIDRKSVETQIIKFKKNLIRDLILKELNRDGQVYFVYNRVKSIYPMAKFLSELVPEAKIGVAHGQMDKNELENVYKNFIEKKYNILLCTTIIESGLDNPDVNTIFIHNADKFGISQLYQLRGRVGRRNVKAYAYFIISSPELISPLALKRLKILQTHSGLSQGFKLAMNDLEIRGAGNLFGEKQSGHILSVGFEYYMDMLEDAIKKLKGEKKEEIPQPEIVFNFPAMIPDDYIEDEKERLYFYKKLSIITDEHSIEIIKEEINDRFGKIPLEMDNLLIIFKIKLLLKEFLIPKLEIKDKFFILSINSKSKINISKILSFIEKNDKRFTIISDTALKIIIEQTNSLQEKFIELKKILNLIGD